MGVHVWAQWYVRAYPGKAGACLAQAAKREDGSRASAAAQGAGKAAAGAKKGASEPKAKAQAPAGEASSAAVRAPSSPAVPFTSMPSGPPKA